MSGTSGDGLDIAYCTFRYDKSWSFELLASDTYPYTDEWLLKLSEAKDLEGERYESLDRDYGKYCANRIAAFIEEYGVKELDAVVSHGHTVFHVPGVSSLQLGSGVAMSRQLDIPVINNLRNADVALGGQGAPIVPIGDQHLFADYRFCLNLGGIANISLKEDWQIRAWDVCGCNLILNHLANQMGLEYDEDGKLAQEGTLDIDLQKRMSTWPYLKKTPPKSLEATEVLDWITEWDGEDYFVADKLRTAVEFIARSVAHSIEEIEKKGDKILITGGGAHNRFLVKHLNQLLVSEVVVPENDIVDYKEAMVMAFFGVLRLLEKPNCLASVTGASHSAIGGELHKPIPA